MWLICFKGQRNQTQRGIVSFQIQLTSIFIHSLVFPLLLQKTYMKCMFMKTSPYLERPSLSWNLFFLDVSAILFGMPWSELDKDSTADNSKHLYCFQYIKMESLGWDGQKFHCGCLEERAGDAPFRRKMILISSICLPLYRNGIIRSIFPLLSLRLWKWF